MDYVMWIISIVLTMMVLMILIGFAEVVGKRRAEQSEEKLEFKNSSAPVPELEITQKVRGRRASDRPVIRATQMRGKARRKF